MKTRISLLTLGVMLWATWPLAAQKTVFQTGFEYDEIPFIFEPDGMNGAQGQIGEWSGDEFPLGIGDILFPGDAVGTVPSPYGGTLLLLDRPEGDPDRPNAEANSDFTGSYFANFSEAVGLIGAEVSFQVGTRRTGGNNEKDYDIIGRDSNGEETFHLRVGTNNNGGERLGYVTDGGNSVIFDLPTVVGDDQAADLDNTGGFALDTGPGLGAEIANVVLRLGADGYVVDFSYPPENTSGNANAYTTDLLSYNGSGVDLAQLEFTYEASGATGRNSGYMLDEIRVTGFDDLLLGDFDGNGSIEFADFLILQANFGTGTTFEQGDFNFDGRVDLADFIDLKAAFNASAQGATAAAVPEPATLGLLACGAVVLMMGRRRVALA